MTLDELLLEWSYRSERGYPSLDNPSDVSILKEILTKLNLNEKDVSNIIDELEDDPQNLETPGDDGLEDSPVQQAKEKQFQQKTKKTSPKSPEDSGFEKVVDKELEKKDIDPCDATKQDINRIIDKYSAQGLFDDPRALEKLLNRVCSFGSYEPLKKLLYSKGFSSLVFKRYATELQNLTEDIPEKDRDVFLDYIKNPNKQSSFPTTRRSNLATEMKMSGVPNSVIEKILVHTTQDEGKRGVGMGELALAIVFKDVTNADGPGDLAIEGGGFEIKAESATLGDKPENHKASLETVKKFEAFGITRDKKMFFNGEGPYALGQLPLILSKAYNATKNKEELKSLVKEMMINDAHLSVAAVEYVFKDIDFTKEESIQQNMAGAHFYNYADNHGFTHFLSHDKGEKSKGKGANKIKYIVGTGEYIYVNGTPGEMVDQLKESGARFERIGFNNMRPRVGWGPTLVEEA